MGSGEGGEGISGQSGAGGKTLRCRSICSVNGTVVPLKVLRALGSALVDVNGQNSQVRRQKGKKTGREKKPKKSPKNQIIEKTTK